MRHFDDPRPALRQEVETLLAETEGRDDAIQYAGDVARDVGVSADVVVAEIDRQLGGR